MDKRKLTKFRKTAIAALCAVSVTCTGLAAACANNPAEPETPSSNQTQREDGQLLKNGNFEYSVVPEKAVHLIKNVNNWTKSGDSSGTMSGVINTSAAAWDKLDSPDLRSTLDYNNDLNSSDPDYNDLHVDYNGMDSDDILYVDSYVAGFENDADVVDTDDIISIHGTYKDFMGVEGDAENGYTYRGVPVYASDDEAVKEFYYDADFTKPLRYTTIDNPQTHLGEYSERDGKFYLGDTEIFKDDDGNYYLDEEHEQPVGNILMLHNYPTNRKYNGIEQRYNSQNVTLEANTAAEISVWVKTAEIKFDKGYSQLDDEDRGAYIEVKQTVASTTIDSFKIRAINTEKILADEDVSLPEGVSSNGWLKYTIYVNACDFSSSTISITLGLGDGNNSQKVTGYAFFDDVEVKKFIDLDDEGCTYGTNAATISDETKPSYCTLTSDEDQKVFIADREVRSGSDIRYSDRFFYLIDLASENVEGAKEKLAIPFGGADLSTTVALTSEESGNKVYASALTNEASLKGGVTSTDESYVLTEAMEKAGNGRPTYNDLIGIFGADHTEFTSADFANTGNANFRDLSARLNSALTGENGLAALKNVSKGNDDMLLILSAYGAAYTATVKNAPSASSAPFTVEGSKTADSTNHKIISFWVKTSDLGGGTAATLKLVDVNDEDNYATFTIDTTDRKVDIGDNKDIYRGWTQCFFFVNNETEDAQEFRLEFGFGNQKIVDTALTSYIAGWAAIADIQTLDVKEDVFDLVSDGSFSKTLSFTEEDEKTGNVFDSDNGMSNVKKGVATPSNYDGVNGGSSFVTDKLFGVDYDRQNNNKNGITGLINRDGFAEYDQTVRDAILNAFNSSTLDAVKGWNEVFGEDCYQPLIIVDSLRSYRDRVKANADNFKQYYIKDAAGEYVLVSTLPEEEQVFDENETYYSAKQIVKNYGYIGATSSVSSNNCKTISVKVKVTGDAVAYVYLVDPDTREVLNYGTPKYTFFYDTEGNVLSEEYDADWTDAEHRDAIVYTLRDDGLYEDENGKLFANLYNLTTRFKYAKFESNTFYKKVGEDYELVEYDDLQDGELYYFNDNGNYKLASHYLVVDVQRVYEYDAATEKYYYVTDGTRGEEVNAFDTSYARYSFENVSALPEYSVEIPDTHGEWVTVNFIIKTGNATKNYRLELWSGKREETGFTEGETSDPNGAVAFDVSSYNITSSNYSTVLSQYENAIKAAYTKLILARDATKLTDDVVTVEDYLKVLDELNVPENERAAELGDLDGYSATYYTYTFYDSADFVPFNKNTADEGQTGYNYSITDYGETLAYFRTYNPTEKSYNIFADYSAIDQSVSLNETTESDDQGDAGAPAETEPNKGANWLLITSVIFALVMLFALAAVLVRYIWKKTSAKRRHKKLQKNNYKQRQRAMRRYRIASSAEDEGEADETPEETPAKTPEETPAETTGDNAETPDGEEATPEETPAEAPEETPAETTGDNAETPDGDDKKDE